MAGVFGLAGNAATAGPEHLYQHADALHDVVSGTNDELGNGAKCGGGHLCVAGPGTPNGIGAF